MRDQGRRGNGGGLHEREVRGLRRECFLPHRRVLRVRTAVAPLIPSDDLAEHLITRFEPRHAGADADCPARSTRYGFFGSAAAYEAHTWQASHGATRDAAMRRARDQHLPSHRRSVDLPKLQDVVGIADAVWRSSIGRS
jgi:hypothetical protein